MNWRFSWVYRLGLAVLFVIAFWSVWASAQTTNLPATNSISAGTNSAAITANKLQAALLKLPEHALTFGLDRVPFLHDNFFLEQPLWKYGASLIYIVLAFVVAMLLDWIVNFFLKFWTSKTPTKYDDLILELLRGPVKVIAFVILLNIGLGIFEWPPRAELFLSRGLIVVVACSLAYVAIQIIGVAMALWRERIVSPSDRIFADTLFPVMQRTVKITVIIIAAMITAENLGINITGLLAGLSVGGLALGLAAQDTVANLFGAVAIFLDKPFHMGDTIKVESVTGTVEGIGLRSTRVRNPDGHHVTIPNKLMGNAIITNITRRPTIRTEMNFGLTYDTPAEKVERATQVLKEVFSANPKTSDLIISFNKFADSALNIFVVHVWNGTDGKIHFGELQAMNLEIKKRFDAEKIEFAFPSQTIYLKSETGK